MKLIRGDGERALRARRHTVQRLLTQPETVTREEARGFIDWARADFQAFVKREQLRTRRARDAARKAVQTGGAALVRTAVQRVAPNDNPGGRR